MIDYDATAGKLLVVADCPVVVVFAIKWAANFVGNRYLEVTAGGGAANTWRPPNDQVARMPVAASGQYDFFTFHSDVHVAASPFTLTAKVWQNSGAAQALGGRLGYRVTALEPPRT